MKIFYCRHTKSYGISNGVTSLRGFSSYIRANLFKLKKLYDNHKNTKRRGER